MAQAQGVLTILDKLGLEKPAALFALAFALRLAWLAFTGVSEPATFHPDSPMFLTLAAGPDWWQGSADRMPGYTLFLHLTMMPFGPDSYWAPIVVQMAIDAIACIAIARTAEIVKPGAGRYAGLFAALNPTQIVLAATMLGDTIFVACLAFGFLSLARLWKGEGGPAAIGFWFGLALFNRAVVWPFLPVLGLAIFLLKRGRIGVRDAVIVLGIVAAFAAPMILRNGFVHGNFALSSQGPIHMALWWYPLVREAEDGTPYPQSFAEMRARYFELRAGRAAPHGDRNPFDAAAIYRELTREYLWALPPQAFVKAWLSGMAINLASPATLMIPQVMKIRRIGFYDTEGETPLSKMRNFITDSSTARYLAWMAGGALIEWPMRLLGVLGLWLLLRNRPTRAPAIFAIAWIGFILAVQGPVASAKYRLPIEPIAMALAGAACAAGAHRRRDSFALWRRPDSV
ncbi:MAG: glycosyltransferase family 39 protein [Alphaproteobacteria bacterium]|nr:glycosyltransferase family 39 protein [Alphaproteobacteria bacterium]